MAQTQQVESASSPRSNVQTIPTTDKERGIRVEWSDGDGLKMSWRMDVNRYYGRGLLGVSGAEIPQGRCVWVREINAVYGAYVRSCLTTGDSYAIDLEFRTVGRREDNRTPVGDPIVATWEDTTQGAMVTEGMVLDVSNGGLQLSVTERVAPGALVRISGDDFECLGSATYCIPTDSGHRVGVQFMKDPALRETESLDSVA